MPIRHLARPRAPGRLAGIVGLALLLTSVLGCRSDAPPTSVALPTAVPTKALPAQPVPPTQAAATQIAPTAPATSYPAPGNAQPATAYPAAVVAAPSAAPPTAQAPQPSAQPKAAVGPLTFAIAHTNDVNGEVDPCG